MKETQIRLGTAHKLGKTSHYKHWYDLHKEEIDKALGVEKVVETRSKKEK